MLKKDNLILGWIIIYFLATVLFFAPVMLVTVVKIISWLIVSITFLNVFPYIFFKNKRDIKFSTLFKCITLMILLTPVVSSIFHPQSIFHGLRMIMDVLPFTFFFFLCKYRVSINKLEKIIWVITAMYIFIFLLALALAPAIFFDASGGKVEELNTGRGIARVKILGSCILHLAFFISINKGFVHKQKKYILLCGFFFLLILLNVSRQHIVFALLVGMLMVFRTVKWYYFALVLGILGGIFFYLIKNVDFVQQMIELTFEQTEDGVNENVRVLSFLYYVFGYNDSIPQIIFGNGIPHTNSSWGEDILYFSKITGFYLSDVGYAKVFFYWGLIGLSLFLLLIFRAIFTRTMDDSVIYCRYYLIFVLLTNIASHSFFTEIIAIVFAIYILEESNRQKTNAKHELLSSVEKSI